MPSPFPGMDPYLERPALWRVEVVSWWGGEVVRSWEERHGVRSLHHLTTSPSDTRPGHYQPGAGGVGDGGGMTEEEGNDERE